MTVRIWGAAYDGTESKFALVLAYPSWLIAAGKTSEMAHRVVPYPTYYTMAIAHVFQLLTAAQK